MGGVGAAWDFLDAGGGLAEEPLFPTAPPIALDAPSPPRKSFEKKEGFLPSPGDGVLRPGETSCLGLGGGVGLDGTAAAAAPPCCWEEASPKSMGEFLPPPRKCRQD